MPGFAGLDTYAFPGDAALAWLKANSNLAWCGYYLAPAPSHQETSWMGRRAGLVATGWGIAPIYVGQQLAGPGSHIVTAAQGAIDGGHAAALMSGEGFPAGACVYLDLEDGPPFRSPRTDYVTAWAAAVGAGGYAPGVYCSHAIGEAVHALVPRARAWAFKVATTAPHPFPGTNFPDPPPAGCGYTGAYMWQLGQSCRIALGTAPGSLEVDLSSAVAPDPGAPERRSIPVAAVGPGGDNGRPAGAPP
jgi:hypothetical protein